MLAYRPLRRIIDALSRARWSAAELALALGGLVVGLGVLAGFTALALHLRSQALADRSADLEAVGQMLAAQADSSLQAMESVQAGLLNNMRSAGIRTAERYAALMATPEMQRMLQDRVSALPYVNAVALVDRDGKLLNVSRVWPAPAVSFADRDYYKALNSSGRTDRYVSQPVLNRVSGDWSAYLARRFDAPDGSLLGIVLGAINLDYFQRFFAEIAPGRDATISLYRSDGQMLVRYPAADPLAGQAQRALVVKTLLNADRGAQQIVSPIDAQERLVAVRSLTHYPIVIIISRTIAATLRPWREQARYYAAIAVLIELSLAAVLLLGIRHLGRGHLLTQAQASQAAAEAERAAADERERHGRALAAYYSRFDTAVSSMSQGLCMFDAQDRLIISNPRLAAIFNLPPEAGAAGTPLATVLRAVLRTGNLCAKDVRSARIKLRRAGGLSACACVVWDLIDGRAFSISYETTAEHGWLMTFEDVTERHRTEAQIVHMAHHDALSGLPNRVLFHQRLVAAVAAAQNGENQALLCVDLDHFKQVNDTLGHPVGDALLQEVTARLLRCARETDTVARLGGDEFAIIQTGLHKPVDATILAGRLIEALSQPYELAGHQVVVGASIGIALLPEHGNNPDELLKNADLSLYWAKANGRGCHCVFTPELDAVSQARRQLENDLRHAVASQQFELHYQPLVNVGLGRISGFEALLRWRHPERLAAGLPVGPDTFIPVAEELGLIIPLGEWVIRTACAEAATWPYGINIAVNLSPVQFRSSHLVNTVAGALAESGLAPNRLELEITETALLKNTDETLKVLHRLHDLGVRIAMDDFGTGYSSLSYLRMFPFDKVKIDKTFVRGLNGAGDCDAIIGGVAVMCRDLGIVSTAEGVETVEQLLALQQKGCTEVQGFLFSPAIPSMSVAALLAMPLHMEFNPMVSPNPDTPAARAIMQVTRLRRTRLFEAEA